MKRVYIAHDPGQAYILRARLEAYGFPAIVQNTEPYGLRGQLALSLETYPFVFVLNDHDESGARQVVQEFEAEAKEAREKRDSGLVWKCPACGETNPENFEFCFDCSGPSTGEFVADDTD